ncbi:MAG: alpha/beta fold hydrolase [Proteobacteria bacterium]|nr:alpha/beta fold hydrolase [Pseudomonadota bacterium]
MNSFKPIKGFRNRHLQSIAASIKLRRPLVKRRAAGMLCSSEEIIVDCGKGVRLQGFYSPHGDKPRDLVILLHGWEGSSESMYLLSSAGHLFNKGFDIFRLNMRDHGDSHHLNKGLFHSCLLDEVLFGVKRIREDYSMGQKTFLCGFSLGGNFALRIGAKANGSGLLLDKIVAICPVIHPPSTMDVLAKGFFVYQAYFIRKWKKSLFKKKSLFPEIYDFGDPAMFKSLSVMTDYFVDIYTDFPDMATYLNGYSLKGDVLKDLTIPAHILSSQDDPVIPHSDLKDIARPQSLSLTITTHGGHCGFITGPCMKSWVDEKLVEWFS